MNTKWRSFRSPLFGLKSFSSRTNFSVWHVQILQESFSYLVAGQKSLTQCLVIYSSLKAGQSHNIRVKTLNCILNKFFRVEYISLWAEFLVPSLPSRLAVQELQPWFPHPILLLYCPQWEMPSCILQKRPKLSFFLQSCALCRFWEGLDLLRPELLLGWRRSALRNRKSA